MTSGVCFLITDVFPFASGEEFLETELPVVAAAFDRVIVVATKTAADAIQTRTVPTNVVVVRAGRAVGGAKNLAQLGKTGLPGVGLTEVRGARLNPAKVALEAVFEGRARTAMAELTPQLQQHSADWGLVRGAQVVVYSYWLHTGARVAMLLAEWLRAAGLDVTKLVSRVHGFDLYPQRSPLGHLPQRQRLLEAFDAIHPVADLGTELLQRTYPEYAHKVSTRRLGTRDPGESVAISQAPFHVVSCAFIIAMKRIDRLPAILKGVQSRGVDVRWTHVGPGDSQAELQAEADRLLGPGKAELVGYRPNAELAQTYRDLPAGVLISLSTSEGVPVTMMEAAALGLPVVATAVGAVSEVVRDGVNGLLIDADLTDQQAIDALVKLATMPAEEYRAMGSRGREIWDADFNADRVYPAWAAELAASLHGG